MWLECTPKTVALSLVVGQENMTHISQSPLKSRADRDIHDYTATFIGIVALLSSFITPLIIRACDARANKPAVEITARFLYPVTPIAHPAIIQEMHGESDVYSVLKVYHPEYYKDNEVDSRLETWVQHHRLFRVIFNNQKNLPVSLTILKPEDLHVETVADDVSVTVAALYASDNLSGGFKARPIITLGPFETRRMFVILSFRMDIGSNTTIRVNTESQQDYEDLSDEDRNNPAYFMRMGQLRKSPADMPFVTRRVQESLWSNTIFGSVRLLARANDNTIFKTEAIKCGDTIQWIDPEE